MKIILPATEEPITIAMARKQCRVDVDPTTGEYEDDDMILLYLGAAREWAEKETGLILAQTGVAMDLLAFPATTYIELESGPARPPFTISYVDPDGNELMVDDTIYRFDESIYPNRLALLTDQVWPDIATSTGVPLVTVGYTLGYTLPGDSPTDAPMPKMIQMAILLVLGHLWQNRADTVEKALSNIPLGASALLSTFIVRKRFA